MHELNIHCLNSKIASMITIKYSLELQYAYNPQPWQRHQILFGISFNWKKWIENVWNQCIQRFLKHQRPLPMPILLSTKGFWWYASPTNQHWKFELWMEMKGLNFKRTFECCVYLDMHTSKCINEVLPCQTCFTSLVKIQYYCTRDYHIWVVILFFIKDIW